MPGAKFWKRYVTDWPLREEYVGAKEMESGEAKLAGIESERVTFTKLQSAPPAFVIVVAMIESDEDEESDLAMARAHVLPEMFMLVVAE